LGSLLAAPPKNFGAPNKWLILTRIPQTPPFKALIYSLLYEGWNFNSDNYLFTTDTK